VFLLFSILLFVQFALVFVLLALLAGSDIFLISSVFLVFNFGILLLTTFLGVPWWSCCWFWISMTFPWSFFVIIFFVWIGAALVVSLFSCLLFAFSEIIFTL